jgi:hypothetical protein
VTDAFLFDAVAEPAVSGDELELELAAIVNREVDLRGVLALAPCILGRGLDAVYGVHGEQNYTAAVPPAGNVLRFDD